MRSISLALLICLLVGVTRAPAEKTLNIGVLAFRDKAQTIQKWQPLANYLDLTLPRYRFALKPYTYKELEDAIERRQVDFVLTHAAHFVQISAMISMSSPLATVIERESDRPMPVYAGTIIVRADRNDIAQLADLKGKTVATSSIQGFASYQMQAYELFKIGLSIPDDVKVIEVELPIDRSVDTVLEGKADAAFARMGLPEQMMREGKLAPNSVKVLNAQKLAGFDWAFSTTLYPLWPFAAMTQVDDELAAQVAAALLMLPHDGEVARASNIWGFTIPANYQPVKEVMQALHISPFDQVPEFSWWDVWHRYRLMISFALLAFAIILLLLVWLLLSRRKLRESEERLSTLIESAPDAIILANAKGLITGWNKGAQHLFGYAMDEILGLSLTQLMPRRYLAGHLAGMERIQSGDQPHLLGQSLEMEALRKDGSEFSFEMVMGSWVTSSGRHFSAIIRDISERKRISQELEAHRHNLEQLVSQRTAELEQAKNTAEAANRAKTVFLANMSHELRTPLNAILGFAQIMQGDKLIPENLRANIAIINRSGNHLLALINDVLEISRIEAGRTTVSKDIFDLSATLQAVREMIRARAVGKGLALVVDIPDQLPNFVLGDDLHLRQVLINLLGNAVKYTEHGEVQLVVSLQPDQIIGFRVNDTGPGIAPDDQERIFQAFYQTEIGVAKGEGTGLGLTISREFIRLMGGELTAHSTLGQGSSFCFALPLPQANQTSSTVGTEYTAGDQVMGLAPGQPSPRILLVEDNPDNQHVAEQLLTQIGCEVCVAAKGQVAVQLFQSRRPHLILIDMGMAEMDGSQVTRLIRSLPDASDVPIVALAASAFQENRAQVIAAGCNEILSKPIEAQCLYRMIGRLLGLRYECAGAGAAKIDRTIDDLGNLPIELRQEISDVATMLDDASMLAIIDRLRADFPDEAEMIAELVKDFRFDKIATLCCVSSD